MHNVDVDVAQILIGGRIPLRYRVDKEEARVLLDNIRVKSDPLPSDIYALARWVGYSLGKHDLSEGVSKVVGVEYAGREKTYDLTVPEGSSYVINGMVCHNTTNLPKDVTNETVSSLCMRAWETGCKGVTMYRKGSREAVIVDESATSENGQPLFITETQAPKRLKELPCDLHRVTVKGEHYLVLVGLLNGRPYEVFAGLSNQVEVPKKTKKGILVKNGKKDGLATYNLKIDLGDDDELVLKDVVSLFDNAEHGALTRMISLSIRHGAPIQFLVEQLKKDKHSDLQSFSGVVARVLKAYIQDGTTVTVEKACPQCASTNLVYQQGCASCTACGWSKC